MKYKIQSFVVTINGDGWAFTTRKEINMEISGTTNLEEIGKEIGEKIKELLTQKRG